MLKFWACQSDFVRVGHTDALALSIAIQVARIFRGVDRILCGKLAMTAHCARQDTGMWIEPFMVTTVHFVGYSAITWT
jgi:hypothetical protein